MVIALISLTHGGGRQGVDMLEKLQRLGNETIGGYVISLAKLDWGRQQAARGRAARVATVLDISFPNGSVEVAFPIKSAEAVFSFAPALHTVCRDSENLLQAMTRHILDGGQLPDPKKYC